MSVLCTILCTKSSQPYSLKYEKANNEHFSVPNILKIKFDVEQINTVRCGNFTCIWMGKRWTYLTVVLEFLENLLNCADLFDHYTR
jgi:hypothetical protein